MKDLKNILLEASMSQYIDTIKSIIVDYASKGKFAFAGNTSKYKRLKNIIQNYKKIEQPTTYNFENKKIYICIISPMGNVGSDWGWVIGKDDGNCRKYDLFDEHEGVSTHMGFVKKVGNNSTNNWKFKTSYKVILWKDAVKTLENVHQKGKMKYDIYELPDKYQDIIDYLDGLDNGLKMPVEHGYWYGEPAWVLKDENDELIIIYGFQYNNLNQALQAKKLLDLGKSIDEINRTFFDDEEVMIKVSRKDWKKSQKYS